ncbi:MAG: FAD:protein FMN transferase [bacterium]
MLSIILLLLLLGSCSGETVDPVREGKLLLGTTINVTLYEKASDDIFGRVFDRVEEIERKMSTSKEDYDTTELLEVNRNAGIRPVRVSADTFEVIRRGVEYSELTDGAFDITIYPLVELWGIGTPDARVPSEEAIQERLALVDYRKVELNHEEQTIYLPEEGMGLDVGAIAKGYAADEARRILEEAGVGSALLDFGGNIVTVGEKPNGKPWKIGIQNPEAGRGRYLGVLTSGPMAVVSSGDYERYFVEDDVRYHHIISSETGYPARSGLASVTILAEDSTEADALSTALYVMGAEEGLPFIRDRAGVEAAFVTPDKQVYMTAEMESVFEITHEEYNRATWPDGAQAAAAEPR